MEQKQIASLENKIKKESGNIAGIIVLKTILISVRKMTPSIFFR